MPGPFQRLLSQGNRPFVKGSSGQVHSKRRVIAFPLTTIHSRHGGDIDVLMMLALRIICIFRTTVGCLNTAKLMIAKAAVAGAGTTPCVALLQSVPLERTRHTVSPRMNALIISLTTSDTDRQVHFSLLRESQEFFSRVLL